MPRDYRDPLDIKLCDCARCGSVLRGADENLEDLHYSDRGRYPKQVAGRVDDRPYCTHCLRMVQAEEPATYEPGMFR